MKIVKAVVASLTIAFLILLIEPIRIFAFLSSIVIIVMLVADSWRRYKSAKNIDA